jgi:hypothetical protein
MLERETEHILLTLTEQTIGARPEIALKEVVAAKIPKGIKSCLQAEVANWLEEDLLTTPRFARIIQKGYTVNPLARTFTRSLCLEYVFLRAEFQSTLDNAVHFLENYLCRPQWTLAQFVFDGKGVVTLDTLLLKLDYLSDYSYYGALIKRFMHRKGLTEIYIDAFQSLLARVDDEIVKRHSSRELALLAKPIYDYLLLCDTPPDQRIPISPLVVFYDDKNMHYVSDYIDRLCRMRGSTELTLDELTRILEDITPGQQGRSQGDHARLTTQRGLHAAQDESRGQPKIPFPSHASTRAPMLDQSEIKADSGMQAQIEERQTSITDQPESVPPEKKNITLSLTYAGMTETPAAPSLADLNTLISGEQRERFIKNLFDDDPAYYANIISALNKTQTWEEASFYLNEFFNTFGLDAYTDEAIDMTDTVYRRYHADAQNPE